MNPVTPILHFISYFIAGSFCALHCGILECLLDQQYYLVLSYILLKNACLASKVCLKNTVMYKASLAPQAKLFSFFLQYRNVNVVLTEASVFAAGGPAGGSILRGRQNPLSEVYLVLVPSCLPLSHLWQCVGSALFWNAILNMID